MGSYNPRYIKIKITIMPEQTETLTQKPEDVVVEDKGNDSGTESESDDSIPELEDTGAGGAGDGAGTNPVAATAGLNEELVSKAKQSKRELRSDCCLVNSALNST